MLVGIDPGWTNLGFAVLNDNNEIEVAKTLNPSDKGIAHTVEYIDAWLETVSSLAKMQHLTMERYVAYKGVHNPRSEEILMLIGALNYGLRNQVRAQAMVRAIDWKPALCKHLFKEKGFRNPSKTFDKDFSMAAAEAICGEIPSSDHVADAICLAYFPRIKT